MSYLHYVKVEDSNVVYIGRHGAKPTEAYSVISKNLVGKSLHLVEGNVELDPAQEALRLVAKEAAETDLVDQKNKRDIRLGHLRNAVKNLDVILVDPIKHKRLLKEIIIGLVGLREE